MANRIVICIAMYAHKKKKKMKFLLLCIFLLIVSVLAEKSERCRGLDELHASGQKKEFNECLNVCRENEDIIKCLRSVEIFQNSFGVWQWRWLDTSAENTNHKPPVGDPACTHTTSHCADGWEGDRCDEPVIVSRCAEGWKGDRCDQKVERK